MSREGCGKKNGDEGLIVHLERWPALGSDQGAVLAQIYRDPPKEWGLPARRKLHREVVGQPRAVAPISRFHLWRPKSNLSPSLGMFTREGILREARQGRGRCSALPARMHPRNSLSSPAASDSESARAERWPQEPLERGISSRRQRGLPPLPKIPHRRGREGKRNLPGAVEDPLQENLGAKTHSSDPFRKRLS